MVMGGNTLMRELIVVRDPDNPEHKGIQLNDH